MSSILAQTLDPPATLTGPSEIEIAARNASRRRRKVVVAARIAILVVALGGWELGARTGAIDPFFFASPSGIAAQVWTWATEGTSQGPLWEQILVTMEETALGFLIGAVGGVVCGIVLGRNRMLADIFSTYIKVANSIPRVVLGSIFI
ncbi:ABC transporter permease, partial [Salmonella enterica]|nr:ABC transporter permease [Salmonella enterica]